MSFNNNKQPAVWVTSFNVGDGTRVYVSEKGALKLTTILPSGEERFMCCLQPAHAMAIVNGAGEIGNFLLSDEYKAIEANKATVKEREKINQQLAREQEKAMRHAQAAIEQLKRLGLDVTVSPTVKA